MERKHGYELAIGSIEEAKSRIKSFIGDAELDSPRFLAFSDLVDLLDASIVMTAEHTNRKADLVEETIRQRKNGVKGYKKEFTQAISLKNDLDSQWSKLSSRSDPFAYENARPILRAKGLIDSRRIMSDIKETHIDKKG